MSRLRPETVVRCLDDLDCTAWTLRLLWGYRPVPPPGLIGRRALPLFVATLLALGPNAGI